MIPHSSSGRGRGYTTLAEWLDMYKQETDIIQRRGFKKGLMVLKSCGGPRLDFRTVELWYQMLRDEPGVVNDNLER